MITRKQLEEAQLTAAEMIRKAGIFVRDDEPAQIQVADFGLSDLQNFGGQILTLVDTDKIGIKLIALYPGQSLPEHWHPKVEDYAGKEETVRVEWGELLLYSSGTPTENPRAKIPVHKKSCFKNWHEHIMHPGDQLLLPPGTPHWFHGGKEGVVLWSFSTQVLDLDDFFSDPDIVRVTKISD
jgi:D-lyxose ketol-isomerase